ncbi:MAG: hypothetical protein QOE83_844 [Actinomycetota bacterium]|jgi:uncharacterized membrane protein YcaP (DUF421 family)|nr:hypothetical protein [Actinomycetota bacterium]
MDIVLRSLALYLFLFVVVRAIGRRELSELSSFELIVMVVLGDLVQQGVTGDDRSVMGAVLAVSTFALLSVVFSYASFRWPRTAPVIEGVPVIVINRGAVVNEALAVERLTVDELHEALRTQGIADPAQVELGVLEADGSFSFIGKDRMR